MRFEEAFRISMRAMVSENRWNPPEQRSKSERQVDWRLGVWFSGMFSCVSRLPKGNRDISSLDVHLDS